MKSGREESSEGSERNGGQGVGRHRCPSEVSWCQAVLRVMTAKYEGLYIRIFVEDY